MFLVWAKEDFSQIALNYYINTNLFCPSHRLNLELCDKRIIYFKIDYHKAGQRNFKQHISLSLKLSQQIDVKINTLLFSTNVL